MLLPEENTFSNILYLAVIISYKYDFGLNVALLLQKIPYRISLKIMVLDYAYYYCI